MPDQEWQQKMNELRDAQLVTQRLMELNERRWDQRFERLESVVERLSSVVEHHDNEIAELRAAMASLIQHIDQFIQGRQSNGH